MGIDYYLVANEPRLVFDLGKNGGCWIPNSGILGERAPKTPEECRARVLAGWLDGDMRTPDELEKQAERIRLSKYGNRDEATVWRTAWVFVEEFGYYIRRSLVFGNAPLPPLEQRIADHREAVAHTTQWADDLWAFVNDPRVGGDWTKLEVVNDAGDLPWWDYDGKPWYQIGSRYSTDRGRVIRLDDEPPNTTIELNVPLTLKQVEDWHRKVR